MYNKFKILIATLSVVVLTGCFSDKDYCVSCNATRIVFTYNDSDGENILDKHIRSALLYVYNNKNELVRTQEVSKEELVSKRGVTVDVPLNENYTAVCWANKTGLSDVSLQQNSNSTFIQSTQMTRGNNTINSHDDLYHGLTTFSFTDGDAAEKRVVELAFKPLHIKMDVVVKGVKQDKLPTFRLSGKMPKFNLKGEIDDLEYKELVPLFKYDDNKGYFRSSFSILNPQSLDGVVLQASTEDTELARIDLKEFTTKNYPTLNLKSRFEIKIEMLIEFNGVKIDVIVPQWSDSDTGAIVS